MVVRILQQSFWFVVLCLVIAVGCVQQVKPPVASQDAESNRASKQLDGQNEKGGDAKNNSVVFDGFVIHEPVMHENLTIFPVSRVEPNLEDRFITLDEGLKNGTVEVFELGAGNESDEQQPTDVPNSPGSNDDPTAGQPTIPNRSPQSNEQPQDEEPSQGDDSAEANQADQAVPNRNVDDVVENQAADRPAGQAAQGEDVNEQLNELHPQQQARENQGNAVNSVYVLNRSERPLYLMPGEIILGGDQDRTIGEEIVIAPSQEPVQVQVFCVEHGRWGGRSRERTTQELAAAINNSANAQSVATNLILTTDGNADVSLEDATQQLSEQAENGKFIASVGVLTKKARVAAQGAKNQSQVWDEVAVANSSANSQVDSGAFTINYVNEENIKRFEAFVEALQDRVANQENVVGVVVAVNGKIDTVEVFESTPLFKKLWPKLLKSYSLEAANQAVASVAEVVESDANDETASSEAADQESQLATCTLQDAVEFLKQAKEANEMASDVKDGLAISHRSNESVDSFSLRIDSPAAAGLDGEEGGGGFGGGGFDGAVHFSGFSK